MANVPPGFPPGGYSPTGSGAPPPAPPGAAPGYRGPMAPPAYGPQGGQGGGGYGPPPAQPGGPAAPPPGYPHAPARPGYAPAYAQPGVQQGGRGQPGVAPGAYPPMGAAPGYGAPGGPAGYGPPGVPPGYGQPGAGPGYPGPAMAPAGPPKTAGGAVDTLKRFGLGPSRLLGLGVGVVALLGVAGYGYWSYSHPTIRFVNASTSPALQVYLDGKPVAADLKLSTSEPEAAQNSKSASVGTGSHKLEAKDASGAVVDAQSVTIEGGAAYLYAPQHSSKVCWTLQTDGYGTAHVANPMQPLVPAQSFWRLPQAPDYWFSDTPNTVQVNRKTGSGSTKAALRQHACGDPNFEP